MKLALFIAAISILLLSGCTVSYNLPEDGPEQSPQSAPSEPETPVADDSAEDVNEQAFYDSPKDITLKYTLNSSKHDLQMKVYGGFGEYLATLPDTISYRLDEAPPTDLDFTLLKIDNESQKEFLVQLVDSVKNTGKTEKEKVLMAVSLIQGIAYDFEAAAIEDNNNVKYPYELLLKEKGICLEKSFFLVYLLRELGYGTAWLLFDAESHAAAGIKCAPEYDFKDTGYCYIETTAPIIMTVYQGEFSNVGELKSDPKVIVVSEGKEYDAKEEYDDAQRYLALKGNHSSGSNYTEWTALMKKYGMEKT